LENLSLKHATPHEVARLIAIRFNLMVLVKQAGILDGLPARRGGIAQLVRARRPSMN
jgi:hypothetical protein